MPVRRKKVQRGEVNEDSCYVLVPTSDAQTKAVRELTTREWDSLKAIVRREKGFPIMGKDLVTMAKAGLIGMVAVSETTVDIFVTRLGKDLLRWIP